MQQKSNKQIITLLSIIIGILALSCALLIFGLVKFDNKDKSSLPTVNDTSSDISSQQNTSDDNQNTSSQTNSNTSSNLQNNSSTQTGEVITLANVKDKIHGVWGYRSYVIYINAPENQYLQAMYATSGGFSGEIRGIKEKGVNVFELEVFVQGHPADEMNDETQDETKFIIFKVDPNKKTITLNGSEYQYITDDFNDDEAISKFFFGDVDGDDDTDDTDNTSSTDDTSSTEDTSSTDSEDNP